MKCIPFIALLFFVFIEIKDSKAGEYNNLINSNLVEISEGFYNMEYAGRFGEKNAIVVYLGRTISNRSGITDYRDRKIADITKFSIFYRRYMKRETFEGAYAGIGLSFVYGNLWYEYDDIPQSIYGPYPQYAYDISDLLIGIRSGYGWLLGRLYVCPLVGVQFPLANRNLLGISKTEGREINYELIDAKLFFGIKLGVVW